MNGQNTIELAFSRPRFAVLVGTAVITGFGLLAAGLVAGIEVGTVQARAGIPPSPTVVESHLPDEEPLPLLRSTLPAELLPAVPALPPTDPSEQYVIQAASFRDRAQAEKLTADLARNGYPAQALAVQDPAGRDWSIVRVGPYRERSEAAQAASGIGRLARSAPVVRVDDGTLTAAQTAIQSGTF